MIIDGLEVTNPSITTKGALLMDKQKNGELSRMFGYAGKFHVLTVLGCVLSGISTILSMLPFVCIWLVIRDLIQAFCCRGYISCNGERPLCVDGGCVCSGKHFNLFYRPELYSSGGVSYSHQYEKICNPSYRDAAVGVFQPKCKRTAQKNH